jgi:type VI secretion system protein ImpJ
MARKLVWTEGLFITQHHFQQLDRYHETLLSERMRAAMSFSWGVLDLAIDERALGSGQLSVSRISCVMPGGAFVAGGDGHGDAIAPRPFDSVFSPMMPQLDVYLALAEEAENVATVSLEPGAAPFARYTRAQEPARDINTGGGEQPVDVARPALRLLFGEERRDGYETLRIGQLVRSASGVVMLKDTCVPPVLRVQASSYLARGFRSLLTSMVARQRALSESRRQRQAGAIELDAGDLQKFWLLGALNSFIPEVSHVVDSPSVHPEHAYLVLARLIGQLCTLATDGDPTAIPKFNYTDLGNVFEPMFARALTLIGAAITERCTEIPLTRRADGVFTGSASGQEIMRSEFFMSVQTTLPEAQVRDRLPRLIKVASQNQIGAILHSAVTGAPVELEYRPPSALPIKPGLTWFRLGKNPEFWTDIVQTGTFAIYHPFEPGALSLALFAVDAQQMK